MTSRPGLEGVAARVPVAVLPGTIVPVGHVEVLRR